MTGGTGTAPARRGTGPGHSSLTRRRKFTDTGDRRGLVKALCRASGNPEPSPVTQPPAVVGRPLSAGSRRVLGFRPTAFSSTRIVGKCALGLWSWDWARG